MDSKGGDNLEGDIDLKIVLPNHKVISVEVLKRIPLLDLLILVSSRHNLQPSKYIILPINEETCPTRLTPNTPVGTLRTAYFQVIEKKAPEENHNVPEPPPRRAALPNISSTLPPRFKNDMNGLEPQTLMSSFRLQIHLPNNQLYVMRVSPDMRIEDVLENVQEAKSLNLNNFTVRNTYHPEQHLDYKETLGYYHIKELTLERKYFGKSTENLQDHDKRPQHLIGEESNSRDKTSIKSFLRKLKNNPLSIKRSTLSFRQDKSNHNTPIQSTPSHENNNSDNPVKFKKPKLSLCQEKTNHTPIQSTTSHENNYSAPHTMVTSTQSISVKSNDTVLPKRPPRKRFHAPPPPTQTREEELNIEEEFQTPMSSTGSKIISLTRKNTLSDTYQHSCHHPNMQRAESEMNLSKPELDIEEEFQSRMSPKWRDYETASATTENIHKATYQLSYHHPNIRRGESEINLSKPVRSKRPAPIPNFNLRKFSTIKSSEDQNIVMENQNIKTVPYETTNKKMDDATHENYQMNTTYTPITNKIPPSSTLTNSDGPKHIEKCPNDDKILYYEDMSLSSVDHEPLILSSSVVVENHINVDVVSDFAKSPVQDTIRDVVSSTSEVPSNASKDLDSKCNNSIHTENVNNVKQIISNSSIPILDNKETNLPSNLLANVQVHQEEVVFKKNIDPLENNKNLTRCDHSLQTAKSDSEQEGISDVIVIDSEQEDITYVIDTQAVSVLSTEINSEDKSCVDQNNINNTYLVIPHSPTEVIMHKSETCVYKSELDDKLQERFSKHVNDNLETIDSDTEFLKFSKQNLVETNCKVEEQNIISDVPYFQTIRRNREIKPFLVTPENESKIKAVKNGDIEISEVFDYTNQRMSTKSKRQKDINGHQRNSDSQNVLNVRTPPRFMLTSWNKDKVPLITRIADDKTHGSTAYNESNEYKVHSTIRQQQNRVSEKRHSIYNKKSLPVIVSITKKPLDEEKSGEVSNVDTKIPLMRGKSLVNSKLLEDTKNSTSNIESRKMDSFTLSNGKLKESWNKDLPVSTINQHTKSALNTNRPTSYQPPKITSWELVKVIDKIFNKGTTISIDSHDEGYVEKSPEESESENAEVGTITTKPAQTSLLQSKKKSYFDLIAQSESIKKVPLPLHEELDGPPLIVDDENDKYKKSS